MKVRILVTTAAWLLSRICSQVLGDETRGSFAVEPNLRQLIFDDVGLEETHALQRTLHQPRQHPANPVIRADRPWEHYCSLYGTRRDLSR